LEIVIINIVTEVVLNTGEPMNYSKTLIPAAKQTMQICSQSVISSESSELSSIGYLL
jgi:hypothetical protein